MHILSSLLVLLASLHHISSQDCQTLRSEINVNKYVNTVYRGRHVEVRCTGRLALNKCEGTCWSYESPSVTDPRGFKKKCNCCREKKLVSRKIVLDECYESVTGTYLHGLYPTISIKEPIQCVCRECASFI
ncbi:partner of bursicon-like [Octopus bimaculoides]|uniref:partner of bursicon-like n=1 Tax=Octopus bimaculoides TaxID=37653 RepID=UPI00071CBF34|nr:partner of bursicon-like [Octopus bimaculoides]|eukprot:XP_014782712.1 PREDICTED: partner of bursicon-like [Octopus bimaculoides]